MNIASSLELDAQNTSIAIQVNNIKNFREHNHDYTVVMCLKIHHKSKKLDIFQ